MTTMSPAVTGGVDTRLDVRVVAAPPVTGGLLGVMYCSPVARELVDRR
jgi:hypothetical protein